MTYNIKNRVLQVGVYEKVKLSKKEHKLLICLSSRNIATYEEMTEYLKVSKTNLMVLKLRLLRKTKLKIKVISRVGYRLEDEIYFE